MPTTPTIDRRDELAVFTKLLERARTGESRVLIIEDGSGRGKSRLLQRFKSVCEESPVAWSSVDLVGGSLTPIDILQRMTADLKGVALERCSNVLNKRGVVSVPVEIKKNLTIGSTTLSVEPTVHLGGLTRDEQKQLWGDAAQGFQHDLREYLGGQRVGLSYCSSTPSRRRLRSRSCGFLTTSYQPWRTSA